LDDEDVAVSHRNTSAMSDQQAPLLDDLATDPSKAVSLSPDAVRSVAVRCAAILAALTSAVAVAAAASCHSSPGEDR
jgi:hypothetical protein